MRTLPFAVIGATVTLALTLGACGGDDKKSDQGKAEDKKSASAGASASNAPSQASESPKPTATPVDPAKFTPAKPGTRLALGQTAVVPFESDQAKGNVEVTVTAIEKGSIDHLTASKIKVDDSDKDSTPYYVRTKFRNVSAADLSHSHPDTELAGRDATGRSFGFTMLFGRFGMCQSLDTKGFAGGAEVEGCTLLLVPAGGTVASVTYDFPDSSQDPVVWKP
ncbi:hypothetical protein [Embleya sp. NBC_00896]|uniref:hypothetical protein n=1 Tax=Embleya sp. NBC_00896 TaxID=2975961 RepID=UPI002F907297|nr:hypothetical protein OG928_43290 [Embleya sp. NBC_00896]